MSLDRSTNSAPPILRLADTPSGQRIGLLAGAGRFPIEFAKSARIAGHSVYCVGIEGLVSKELIEVCDGFDTTPLAKLGRAIRLFQRRKIDEVVMAGKVEKVALFQRWQWLKLMPDL